MAEVVKTEKIEIEIVARKAAERCVGCGIFPPTKFYAFRRAGTPEGEPDAPFEVELAVGSLVGWSERIQHEEGGSQTRRRYCPKCGAV